VSRKEAYEQAAICYRRAGYDLEAARCYRLAGAHRRAAEIYEAVGQYEDAAISFADAGLPEIGAWQLAHFAGQTAQARALIGVARGENTRGALSLPGAELVYVATVYGQGGVGVVLDGRKEYVIGRDPSADIVLDDSRVNWRHAVVSMVGDLWVFHDPGSTTGSWLGQRGVSSIEIQDGLIIRLGSPDDGPALDFMGYNLAAYNRPARPPLRCRLVLARCEIAEGAASDTIRSVTADVCRALADKSVRFDQVIVDWAVALSEAAARYDQAALVFAAAVRGGRHGAEHRWKVWSVRALGTEVVVPIAAEKHPAS
jgi:hypothetical protein